MEVHKSGGNPFNFFVGKESAPSGSAQKIKGKLQNAYAAAVKDRVLTSEAAKGSESGLQLMNITEAKGRAFFNKINRFAQGRLG